MKYIDNIFLSIKKIIYFFIISTIYMANPVSSEALIEGPIPGKPLLELGKIYLNDTGYKVEEFFISGQANSFSPKTPLTEDGFWSLIRDQSASFKTRIVVVRPLEPKKFNGTVVVEWLNVSLGQDLAADWIVAHREITRSGFAYVGVSAQKVGVEGGPRMAEQDGSLKALAPSRYSTLAHPGDAFSYDMFSQVGKMLRSPQKQNILGLLNTEKVLAIGESQSAMYLTSYVNAVAAKESVFDGYLIHARFSASAPLDGSSIFRENSALGTSRIRTDIASPIIIVESETDVIGGTGQHRSGYYYARQSDHDLLRIWEIAGSSHADNYISGIGLIDFSKLSIKELAQAYKPVSKALGMPLEKLMNNGPQQHYIVQSALQKLDHWVRTGIPAPKAPRLTTQTITSEEKTPLLKVDKHGIAQGGVRTPWVDVPTSRLSGIGNFGGPMGTLAGITEPFDQEKLKTLYPKGQQEYLQKFKASLDATILAGFILQDDRSEIEALASCMYPSETDNCQ